MGSSRRVQIDSSKASPFHFRPVGSETDARVWLTRADRLVQMPAAVNLSSAKDPRGPVSFGRDVYRRSDDQQSPDYRVVPEHVVQQ